MAKNNAKVLVPRFLDMKAARELNNLVYKNTGCFLFMTLPEEKLLCPRPTAIGGDNYCYNVLNLYKMYYDFGHYFLWFSLQESQLPQVQAQDDAEIVEKLRQLRLDRQQVIDHYTFITGTARHVLAHGIFQQYSMLNPYSDPKVSAIEAVFGEVLSDRNWPVDDRDWRRINQWLLDEADFAYKWIESWATLWEFCPGEKEDLKRRFYYGKWEFSKNKDTCVFLDEEKVTMTDKDGSPYYLYDDRSNKMTSFARAFPFQLIYDAKDYLVAAVSDCVRTQYEEDGFWRSDKPDSNLNMLCRNINFYGIENAREQLFKPKRQMSVCPDAFKLYLEGLSGKMLKLPVIASKPRKPSRFKRK